MRSTQLDERTRYINVCGQPVCCTESHFFLFSFFQFRNDRSNRFVRAFAIRAVSLRSVSTRDLHTEIIIPFFRRKEEEELARKRQRDEVVPADSTKRVKNEPNGDHKNTDQPQNENNQNSKNSNHRIQNGNADATREISRQERREPLTDVLIPPSR